MSPGSQRWSRRSVTSPATRADIARKSLVQAPRSAKPSACALVRLTSTVENTQVMSAMSKARSATPRTGRPWPLGAGGPSRPTPSSPRQRAARTGMVAAGAASRRTRTTGVGATAISRHWTTMPAAYAPPTARAISGPSAKRLASASWAAAPANPTKSMVARPLARSARAPGTRDVVSRPTADSVPEAWISDANPGTRIRTRAYSRKPTRLAVAATDSAKATASGGRKAAARSSRRDSMERNST